MGILTKPKKVLPTALFDATGFMIPEVKEYLLNELYAFIPEEKVRAVYLGGSMAGRKWEESSDIDIQVFLAEGESKSDWRPIFKQYKNVLPGTRHEIQFFERAPGLSLAGYAYSPFGVYDLRSDTWLSSPRDYEEIRDPDDQFRLELHFAHMVARQISRSYQHLLDDIQDLKVLTPNTEMYEEKMEELRHDIYTLLDYARKLDKDRKDVYKAG